MTDAQWQAVVSFRTEFRNRCAEWSGYAAELQPLQKLAAEKNTPPYPLENSVVYNTDLDRLTPEDDIRLIVIGDNPGKNEQLKKNRRYLVGQAGKIADGFFRRNPELAIDFRKNVLILNKTPVHTAKTAQLKILLRQGSDTIRTLINESQIWMARKTAELHQNLLASASDGSSPELWLVGYAELKNRGLFLPYRDELAAAYRQNQTAWQRVFVYQHFSMNRFLIDLRASMRTNLRATMRTDPNTGSTYRDTPAAALPLAEALNRIGEKHRNEIFAISG